MSAVVTIIGIVVSAAVALIIGDLHRRQMRQIEAFRVNPDAGLIPPTHPARLWFRHHIDHIVIVVLALMWVGGIVVTVVGFRTTDALKSFELVGLGATLILAAMVLSLLFSLGEIVGVLIAAVEQTRNRVKNLERKTGIDSR